MKPASHLRSLPGLLGGLMACVCLSGGVLLAQPAIQITSLPAYGVFHNGLFGSVQGTVSGVDYSTHRVALYIYIDGAGWYNKPFNATPTTTTTVPISPTGTFQVDLYSWNGSELDAHAVSYCAALVSATDTPPSAGGAYRVPTGLNALAVDFEERYAHTFSFAGRTWARKAAPLPVGPGVGSGKNYFSPDPADVWVDGAGLHLTIHQREGKWWCTEVILLDDLGGHGSYTFKTSSRNDQLDKFVTFGAFTWDPYGDDTSWAGYGDADLISRGSPYQREIDFEDSRWGNVSGPNSQVVVQPWGWTGNLHAYSLPDLTADSNLTRVFTWAQHSIRFLTLKGSHSLSSYPQAAVHDDWTFHHAPVSNHYVPPPGREKVHLNIWLNQNAFPPAPSDGQPAEVIVTDFTFTPLTPLQLWRQAHFNTIYPESTAADTADPDGDGLANLIEFVLGANPIANSTPGIALINNSGTLEFTYSRSTAAVGNLYINVVWSDTLNGSSWTNSGVTQTVLSDNGTTQQVKAAVPAGGGGRRFLRLHVATDVPTFPPADPGGPGGIED